MLETPTVAVAEPDDSEASVRVLVDLERHRVLDLLPDREAATRHVHLTKTAGEPSQTGAYGEFSFSVLMQA